MKPLYHAKCCQSALDRARHELDRAIKAREFDEKLRRPVRQDVARYEASCRRKLEEMELEAIRKAQFTQ